MKAVDKKHFKAMRLPGRLLLLGFTVLAFIANCAATPHRGGEDNIQFQQSVKKTKTAQLIIKFRNNFFDPSKTAFVKQLSRDAQATLSYIRPMSGGAHVFAVENISADAQLTQVLQRLSQRPDVLYIQQDKIMRHQKVP